MRLSIFLALLPLVTSKAIHSPLHERKKGEHEPYTPEVQIHPYASTLYKEGVKISGIYDEDYDQDVYLGIPYAEPPVGPLRWRRPLPYNYTENIKAQITPPACLQDTNNPWVGTDQIAEDCLFVNVWTPSGVAHRSEPVPVIVYLHPGGWAQGSGAAYNGTNFVARSQDIYQPVIYISLNYRLGVLGWPFGTAFDHARAGNLGLRDVRRALEWIRENICYFGGDPRKVTLHGHSAGAVIISQLYFDTEIDLFSSAIMSSGATSSAPIGPTNGTWEIPYETFLNLTHCNSTQGGDIECLRDVSAEQILQAQLTIKADPTYSRPFIYGPSVDSDLIPDQPWILLQKGIFASIPFIQGQTKDEGTGFTPLNITEETLIETFELSEPVKFPANFSANVTTWYPRVPERGAPFGTHNETFGLDPAYKQFGALFTDAFHTAPRRHFVRSVNEYAYNRSWTYTWDHPAPGTEDRLGAVHLSDLPYILGDVRAGVDNWTEKDEDLSDLIRGYFLNFTYYGNPNGPNSTNPYIYPDPYVHNNTTPEPPSEIVNSTYWTEHDLLAGRKDILRFDANNTAIIQDNYREGSVEFINAHWDELNY